MLRSAASTRSAMMERGEVVLLVQETKYSLPSFAIAGLRELFPIADGIRPVRMFAHYVEDDRQSIRRRFARVHEDVLYERRFDS